MEDCEKLGGLHRNMQQGEGSKGNFNAITDTATVLYCCSETDLGHTFRYLYVYLGDSI